MPFEIRAIEPDEIGDLLLADQRAFGSPPSLAERERSWTEAELSRTRAAFDGGEAVGVSRNYSFQLTLPGGHAIPAAAVSWVGVQPTYRRRGVLTQLMGALHDDAREHGEPVAMLTASESSIYGRFGYGVAAWRVGVSADAARITFRSDTSAGHIRLVLRDEAEKRLPAIYEALRLSRAGLVTRPDYWWPSVFWDQLGGADKAFFTAIHTNTAGVDDGYVAYDISGSWHNGIPDRRATVWDLVTADDEARAALWRYVFGLDLVDTVVAVHVPIDDPLRHLVTDGRRIRIDYVNDGLWLAPLDPAQLLAARGYTVEGRLVIETAAPDGTVTRVELDGGPAGATCGSTTREPDITCTSATLGACAIGGNRWSELAQAGLVDARDRATLVRADTMFMTTPAPALLTSF